MSQERTRGISFPVFKGLTLRSFLVLTLVPLSLCCPLAACLSKLLSATPAGRPSKTWSRGVIP